MPLGLVCPEASTIGPVFEAQLPPLEPPLSLPELLEPPAVPPEPSPHPTALAQPPAQESAAARLTTLACCLIATSASMPSSLRSASLLAKWTPTRVKRISRAP